LDISGSVWGKGNAAEALKITDSMLEDEKWSSYFKNFVFPYGLYVPGEYDKLLKMQVFQLSVLKCTQKTCLLKEKTDFSLGLLQHGFLIYSRYPKS
jgi:hypothetical protein